MATPDLPRDEMQAAIDARRELGPEMEPAVIDAFVDRMERAIEARVDARLGQQASARPVRRERGGRDDGLSGVVLPVASLGAAIPLTAIAASTAGFLAVLIVWLGIVAVNWAYAQRPR